MQYQIKNRLRTLITIVILLAFSISSQSLFADEIFNKICSHTIRIGEQVVVAAGTILMVYVSINKGLPIIHYYLSSEERARVQREQQEKEVKIARKDAKLCMLGQDNLALRTPEQEKKLRITCILLRQNVAKQHEIFGDNALRRHHLIDQSEEPQPA